MKSKKKLLIAMAAMSVAAIGAGTVSTFAWYTAEATAINLSGSGASGQLATTTSEVSLDNVVFTFTISTGDTLQLSNVNGSNVEYGGVPKGAVDPSTEKQVHNWDGDNSTKLIGTYSVSVASWTADAKQKEALKKAYYDFNLEAKSNVVILDAAAGTLTLTSPNESQKTANITAARTAAASTPTFRVTFDADGDNPTITVAKPYFCVRTNNANGNEYVSSGSLGVTPDDWNQSKSGGYAAGDHVKYTVDSKVYVANSVITENATWAEGDWKLIDHTEDKIQLVAGQTNVTKTGVTA